MPQRWVIYASEAARDRAQKRAEKQLLRWSEQERKAFSKLTGRTFNCRADNCRADNCRADNCRADNCRADNCRADNCRADAEATLAVFASTLKATRADEVEVLECMYYNSDALRWAEGKLEPDQLSYCLAGKLVDSDALRAELVLRGSLFIVTTNELDEGALAAEALLAAYKGQAQVERGFRFLKDPMFLASSLFLRNEKRIMALLMVMTLCLLVYAALEWRIREELRRAERSFPDQKGKPTQRPTARWVFECFVGMHVLMMGTQQLVLNLKERHQIILDVLGARYQLFYSSPPT